MTIWMANNWKIMLGGKPFSSIPPYTIIAFELTILFGGLMTLLGLLVFGRLPRTTIEAEAESPGNSDERQRKSRRPALHRHRAARRDTDGGPENDVARVVFVLEQA